MRTNDIHFIAGSCLFVVNLFAFVLYGCDKLCAKRGWRRVPEKLLLLVALFGGSLGALAAMFSFRHKTLHLKFKFGVPLMLILQIAGLIYLHL